MQTNCDEKQKSMEQKKFKYQKQIDELIALGCQLPALFEPNNMNACRFAFSEPGHVNHIPQYISNPKRILHDISQGNSNPSLLALSCFTTPEHACCFYQNLSKAFKKVAISIGNSLAEGILTENDGKNTAPSSNGHFDFYEYEGCDLSKSFQITKALL